MKITNEQITLEDFSRKINENYTLEKQQERIDSYIQIVKSNIKGNITAGKTNLNMRNAIGYLDNLDQEDYLHNQHKQMAQELKLTLTVKVNLGDIAYTW